MLGLVLVLVAEAGLRVAKDVLAPRGDAPTGPSRGHYEEVREDPAPFRPRGFRPTARIAMLRQQPFGKAAA